MPPTATDVVTAIALAEKLQHANRTIAGRLTAILATLWGQVDMAAPVASWQGLLGDAAGAFAAAQYTAASTADPYVSAVQDVLPGVGGQAQRMVNPGGFAGMAASGLDVTDLLGIPAARAQSAREQGLSPDLVRQAGVAALSMYAHTEVADASRNAVQVATVTHHISGYVRVVGAFCCSRCGILSGRWYRYSSGFERHPNCHCTNLPCDRTYEEVAPEYEHLYEGTTALSENLVPSPQELLASGRITDLTQEEMVALRAGADLAQIVNAHRGMYVAGGHEYTTTGTTMRGVAGARLLARAIARAGGAAPGGVYRNFTISRTEVLAASARYGGLMRQGVPFIRNTPTGPVRAAYRFATAPRMTVGEIVKTATSREDLERQLINNGFLL